MLPSDMAQSSGLGSMLGNDKAPVRLHAHRVALEMPPRAQRQKLSGLGSMPGSASDSFRVHTHRVASEMPQQDIL